MLRFSPGNGEIKIGDDSLRLQKIRITVKDVEDAGPGLLVDHADREGRQVIVWTEWLRRECRRGRRGQTWRALWALPQHDGRLDEPRLERLVGHQP